METRYQNTMEHLRILAHARVPIVWIVTHEEKRLTEDLYTNLCIPQKKELWTWSGHQGLSRFEGEATNIRASGEWENSWNAPVALNKIASYKQPSGSKGTVYLLRDFHSVLAQSIPRQLRDLYDQLIADKKMIIICAPCVAHGPSGSKPGIEPTLDKQITVLDYELPSRQLIHKEISSYLDMLSAKKKTLKLDYTQQEIEEFTRALQGTTLVEAANSLCTSFVHLKKLDATYLLQEKKQIIKRSDILEYIEQTPTIAEVGGLDEAKHFFTRYNNQFSEEAQKFGVEPLKGVLLTGVPGTGKSLLAKAVATLWKLPALRLDVGKVMNGLVGGSEQKMREVVQQAEAIAPAVLWVDEIEKSLSGTKSSNFSDGGTLSRVFGTLLTAMEERLKDVIVIATANDIQALPPELIRRFNEIFFVDLPVAEEREEIFRIHLTKRGRDADQLKLDMARLVKESESFTGDEIQKAVKEGIVRAYHDGQSPVTTEHISQAIKDTKPIAKVMGDVIGQIRDWARDKARYASSLAAARNAPCAQTVTTAGGRELDLEGDLAEIEEVVQTPKEEASSSGNRLDDFLDD